jgi:hypothetical protein
MERPILIFPEPEIILKDRKYGGSTPFHVPSLSRQYERLSPKFTALIDAFESQRVELQADISGVEPEKALVIETRGSVDDFIIAVRHIDGLEWLGEIDLDEMPPDTDFYRNEGLDLSINGRLYLVMTNQEALNEMLSLWHRYSEDPLTKFPNGKTKLRDLFSLIYNIRYWSYKERLIETGIIQSWEKDLESDAINSVLCKIELWYRKSEARRNEAEETLRILITENGGQIFEPCVIPEIEYHALIAELPVTIIREIIQNPVTRLTQCDDIMYFRPTGQSVSKNIINNDNLFEITPDKISVLPVSEGNPIIALFDGLPLENHVLLTNRIIIDDPEGWASEYEAKYRYHGTAMASLILFGDLNNGINPILNPIYARPILKPHPLYPEIEIIPEENRPYLDLIYRAVKRLFEGEGEIPPVSPEVKIINFSVGDSTLPYDNAMSPLARLLDWLSFQYNVLFIISGGNNDQGVILPLNKQEFENLSEQELETTLIRSLYLDINNRRIISPAESLNGITVGSLHVDYSNKEPEGHLIDVISENLPSPISPFGFGYRKVIKPDLVYPGGKGYYNKPLYNQNPICLERNVIISNGPGCKLASPGKSAGDLFYSTYDQGTSLSAALISRYANFCYYNLINIFNEHRPDLDFNEYLSIIIKAMIIHGCSWNQMGDIIKNAIDSTFPPQQLRNWISRWIGYGTPDFSKIQNCPENRISLIGFGKLSNGQAHLYHLPLPPSLSGIIGKRRITVTLAYFSPIFPGTQKYLGSDLWFALKNILLNTKRKESDNKTVQRGTVQHEIFEGEDATIFDDGDTLDIQVNCREFAGKHNYQIPYSIIVSLETAEELNIQVYDEVRTRIAPPIQISNISVEP